MRVATLGEYILYSLKLSRCNCFVYRNDLIFYLYDDEIFLAVQKQKGTRNFLSDLLSDSIQCMLFGGNL